MYPPNYLNPQSNTLLSQQQRLLQLEQQQNMMNNNIMSSSYQQPQGIYLKGRAVTGIEEVRGTIIDQDGSLFIFPDIGHNKIYTKQINIDGTATINSFTLEKTPVQTEQKYVEVEQMNKIINSFNQQIQILQQKVEEVSTTETSNKKVEEKSVDKTKISW